MNNLTKNSHIKGRQQSKSFLNDVTKRRMLELKAQGFGRAATFLKLKKEGYFNVG